MCEMRFLVVIVLACLVRLREGGALPSPTSETKEPSFTTEGIGRGPKETISEQSDGQAECLAGSEWQSNCHSCKCSAAGVPYCVRQDSCQEEFGDPLKCKPNSTFVRDCNTCVCLDSGLGLCTVENCRRPVLKKSELPPGKECAPGTYWKSQCNDCGCSPYGFFFCTEKACPNQEFEPVLRCAPDSIWNNQCNTCWCTADGLPMCTKMGCPDSAETVLPNSESSSLFTDLPGSDAKLPDNIESHLKNLEEPSPNIEDYRSEEHEKGDLDIEESHYINQDLILRDPQNKDINILKTGYDQENYNIVDEIYHDAIESDHIVSEVASDEEQQVKNEDLHILLKRSVCKPNQIFRSECNSCKCAADGLTYTCSHNECMDGETNKEVEVFMESEGVDHIERHSVCKAGGTFYIGCNTCHCNLYGTDYSCTNKPCPLPEDVELFHELKATKSSKNTTQKVVCVANRMFIKDCNTCWCNDNGTGFFCTRKVCVQELPDDGSEEIPEDLRIIKKECRPGEVFELDCNMCRCNSDGKSYSCTRRACVEPVDKDLKDLRIIKKECRPDEVFELDCNMCRCNPDGKSYSCTRRACVEPVDEDLKISSLPRKTRATQSETPKACQPGQEFRVDCNKCLCDNEGQDFSCTRNDCNALNNQQNGARLKRELSEQVASECIPGSVFDRDCNVCRCTDDGLHAMCTMKRCTVPSEETEISTPQPGTDPNFRCNPGEQFKRGCNDCSCSADGKSVFCTVRYCDQDITVPPSR